MSKLPARGALRREAAGEGADFVAAADVYDRALEDRVYREAIDHGLDLAIVERAAIAREEIVDRCTIFEIAFAHSLSPWSGFVRAKLSAECRVSQRRRTRAVARRVRCCFWPHSGHSAARRIGRRTEDIGGLDRPPA